MDAPRSSSTAPETLTPRELRRRRFNEFKNVFGLSVSFADVLSDTRTRDVVLVRQILIWARSYAGQPMGKPRKTVDVGNVFNRDHTTVVHTLKKLRAIAYTGDARVSTEGLELLLEAAYALEKDGSIPDELKTKIVALREKEGEIIRNSSQI